MAEGNPYVWRAILRDGRVVKRGDVLDGVEILSPVRIPEGKLLELKLEKEPGNPHKWRSAAMTLLDGEKLIYSMTREASVNAETPQEEGGVMTVAFRLGVSSIMGKSVWWLFPTGDVIFSTTESYEEMIQSRSPLRDAVLALYRRTS